MWKMWGCHIPSAVKAQLQHLCKCTGIILYCMHIYPICSWMLYTWCFKKLLLAWVCLVCSLFLWFLERFLSQNLYCLSSDETGPDDHHYNQHHKSYWCSPASIESQSIFLSHILLVHMILHFLWSQNDKLHSVPTNYLKYTFVFLLQHLSQCSEGAVYHCRLVNQGCSLSQWVWTFLDSLWIRFDWPYCK